MAPPRKHLLGLTLGSGSARGWAHIGVIRALDQAGVRPDIVCGTSIGALVGAAYAAGELDRLEEWATGLRFADVLGFMDVSLRSGLVKGERLMGYFRRIVSDRPLEELHVSFGAVATALHSDAEVWLRSGSMIDAVRASTAMPGLFPPQWYDDQLLVDGGLVNPVPVSLARAMGADTVIAVDLASDILGRHLRADPKHPTPLAALSEGVSKLWDTLSPADVASPTEAEEPRMPNIFDVLASSLNIMQVRIARSRMAGDPPDLVVAPRLAHLRLLDFHRAQEAIDEGRRAVERVAPALGLLDALEP